MSTGHEFKRLLRRTMSGTEGAPWWARWMLQTVVMAGVVLTAAHAIDWIWPVVLGRPAFAVCALFTVLPLGLVMSLGTVVAVGGGIGVIVGARAGGVAAIIIGAILMSAPDLIAATDFGAQCP